MDIELIRAIKGYSASGGGLNLSEFRTRLGKEFPRKKKKINNIKTRKELEAYCEKDRNIQARIKRSGKKSSSKPKPKTSKPLKSSKNPKPTKDYFKEGSKLTASQKKMCRCIAHVSAKNPDKCYEGQNPGWKKGPNSLGCRNPYSICRAAVGGGGSIRCYEEYDFRKMPKDEVSALKKLHGKI